MNGFLQILRWMQIETLSIIETEDLVLAWSVREIRDGDQVSLSGRGCEIMRRQADGR